MPITFGVFRNDGDDGDRSDGDVGGDGAVGGGPAIPGTAVNPLLAQALWRTRGDLTNGLPAAGNKEISPPMKPLERDNIVGRWSPDVRAYLYSFELLSGLHFNGDMAGDRGTLLSLTVGEDNNSCSSESVTELRRPAYDLDPDTLRAELDSVTTATALRQERMAEILTQVQVPYPFFAAVMNLQAGRHRYTYELMSAVFRLSSTVVMQFKNHLRVRRPADRSPLIQPVLPTPGHGSYPAGHSTQCHFVAAVLKTLLSEAADRKRKPTLDDVLAGPCKYTRKLSEVSPALGDVSRQLDVLADRIAYNRVVAGLHYVEDNRGGVTLGTALAAYFLQRVRDGRHAALAWLWERALDEWANV
jgi:hypothetical protein